MLSMSSSIDIDLSEKRNLLVVSLVLAVVIGYTIFSYSIALFAFISPSAELRWGTNAFTDQPSYSRGTQVTLTGFLEEGTAYFNIINYYYFTYSETVTWGVIVLSSDNTPVYIVTGTLTDQGDITLDPLPKYDISPTASVGTYKVRIMVWSDLLPSGETRTITINEETFQVTS